MKSINKTRCDWCGKNELYIEYHDKEWGVPIKEDKKLFEMLLLETFQAGLSWITILTKREDFRAAFDGFDFNKIADYENEEINKLMMNSKIIRNRLKIESSIKNAQSFKKIVKEHGSFAKFLWAFVDNKAIQNKWDKLEDIPASTKLSDKISSSLKKKGFKFIGTTTVYAYMQAVGLVNDHLTSCFRHKEIEAMK